MKKLILSILTFFYLAVSSGVAMEIHYCMGKRAGVDLYKIEENNKCGRCGMKDKKGGCCNDEHKFVKLATEHKNISNDHNFDAPFVLIAQEHFVFDLSIIPVMAFNTIRNNSPPNDTGTEIYLRNCNFRL